MGKATTYILVISGMMLLFYYAGLLSGTASVNSALLDLLLNVQNIKDLGIWTKVVLVIELFATGAAIILGVFRNSPELFVTAPIAIYMANLFFDFLIVYKVIASAAPVLAVLVFAPIIVLFTFTIVEWWRGRD